MISNDFEILGLFTSPNPKWILDLFCGAGGSTRGYQYAGFNVIGVDTRYQPNYCGDEFHRGDALEYLESWVEAGEMPFAAIHASPPCQHYSILKYTRPGWKWPDLLEPTRKLLRRSGLPYIIENVEYAPLKNRPRSAARLWAWVLARTGSGGTGASRRIGN